MPIPILTPTRRRAGKPKSAIRIPKSVIASDTPLMPWIIADTVCEEAARYLDSPVPLRFSDYLDAKAERCYAGHRQFRKLLRAAGNEGRDTL